MPVYMLVLALFCAAVLGGVGWLQFLAGEISVWKVAVYAVAGGLLPFLYAFAWALLVVPPSLAPLLRRCSGALSRMFMNEREP
jgi:hypothetical protein